MCNNILSQYIFLYYIYIYCYAFKFLLLLDGIERYTYSNEKYYNTKKEEQSEYL